MSAGARGGSAAAPEGHSPEEASVVVGLVVRDDGAVLVAKKRVLAGHFLSGAWHVPGGRVEAGESPVQAMKRELREEAGIEVDVGPCLGVVEVAAPTASGKVAWYRCAPRSHDLVAGDDVSAVEYVSPAEAIARFPAGSGRNFPEDVKRFFGLASALSPSAPSRG